MIDDADVQQALVAALGRARLMSTGTVRRAGDKWRSKAGQRQSGAGMSGAHPDARDPQQLQESLAQLVGMRGWGEQLTVGSIWARWEELLGGPIATNSKPETFADGVLHIRARSTTWANQLRWFQDDIVARLNAGLGDDVVREIRVQGPVAPSWVKGPLRVKGPGPRDTYG